ERNIRRRRRVAEIEMHVDIDIEFARKLEYSSDLAGMVAVVIRRGADHLGALAKGFHQELVRAGIVGEPFLGKDTDLEIDRPAIIGDQRRNALKAAQADTGIDFDMGAHARRAVEDGAYERRLGTRAHVVDGEVWLQRPDALHRRNLAPLLGARSGR